MKIKHYMGQKIVSGELIHTDAQKMINKTAKCEL